MNIGAYTVGDFTTLGEIYKRKASIGELNDNPPFKNILRASLKTGLNRENRQGTSAARKTDEARLYALQGGLTQQTAYPANFTSNEVFRDALK